jgi:hypothetical protein
MCSLETIYIIYIQFREDPENQKGLELNCLNKMLIYANNGFTQKSIYSGQENRD